jgi:putative effector of murein hydrolase
VAEVLVAVTIGLPLLNRLDIKDWAARGLAMGVSPHGIGADRRLRVNESVRRRMVS